MILFRIQFRSFPSHPPPPNSPAGKRTRTRSQGHFSHSDLLPVVPGCCLRLRLCRIGSKDAFNVLGYCLWCRGAVVFVIYPWASTSHAPVSLLFLFIVCYHGALILWRHSSICLFVCLFVSIHDSLIRVLSQLGSTLFKVGRIIRRIKDPPSIPLVNNKLLLALAVPS